MGYYKILQLEMDELWSNGYVLPRKCRQFLCANHFSNKYLNHYILEHGHCGVCTYCGNHDCVIDLADFIEYIGKRLTNFLSPIDDEGLPLASSWYDDDDEEISGFERRGPFIAPQRADFYEDVNDMVDNFDLISDNERLNEDIAKCFNVNQWIQRDPTELLLKDELLYSWNNFANLVKTRCRYTFFRNNQYYSDYEGGEKYVSDIVAEVCSMVVQTEKLILQNTLIYRGRPEDSEAPFSTFKSLTAPPVKSAKANRMSPYGISMFYGSFDESTPLAEIRNYLSDKTKSIYVGKFRVTKPLKVINLCNMPVPDFWMKGEDDWQKFAFLHKFHSEISKPIGENDDPELEYIPSQVFSGYLRLIQKSMDGRNYDGIIYQSALTKQRNIVLFYDNESSRDVLELADINVIKP